MHHPRLDSLLYCQVLQGSSFLRPPAARPRVWASSHSQAAIVHLFMLCVISMAGWCLKHNQIQAENHSLYIYIYIYVSFVDLKQGRMIKYDQIKLSHDSDVFWRLNLLSKPVRYDILYTCSVCLWILCESNITLYTNFNSILSWSLGKEG